MNSLPPNTKFVSRGRLNGVLRQPAGGAPATSGSTQPAREQIAADEVDTQTYEAVYYRARLVLGDSLPRPPRFQLRGH